MLNSRSINNAKSKRLPKRAPPLRLQRKSIRTSSRIKLQTIKSNPTKYIPLGSLRNLSTSKININIISNMSVTVQFNTSIVTPQEVIDFWYLDSTKPNWFAKSDDFDIQLKNKFGTTLEAASKCELSAWRTTPEGRLAEIIVLDQFSRNIYRNSPQSFAQDPIALALCQTAVALGDDQKLSPFQRMFLYMPMMHSESKQIHQDGLALWESLGLAMTLDFAIQHKKIIDRFNRYPHRNKILNRESSTEEIEFLSQPGSSF